MELIIGLVVLYLIYRAIKSSSTKKKAVSSPQPSSSPDIYIEISTSYGGERATCPKGSLAKWHRLGETVKGKNFSIPGMVYVGENLPDSSGYYNDASLINDKLKVISAEPWEGGEEMGYWPSYDRIPAKCRGAYLKWLATGRSEPEAYIGYVFLFFTGLNAVFFMME